MTDRPAESGTTLSKNVRGMPPSPLEYIRLQAHKHRSAGEDVVDLAFDEPRIEMPRPVAEAGSKVLQQSRGGSTPDAGLLELRASIARHLSLLSAGRAVNADNIIVSTGARQSIFGACFSLFDSSDEILLPSPSWEHGFQTVALSRARPVSVPGEVEWSLKVGVDQLNRAATPDTAGVVLCNPVNPTGAVYTKAELRAILEWALERGCWVISDEVCRRIHFGSGPAPSVLDLPDELLGRVVVVGGASKTYALGGWRLGFCLAPRAVVKAMAELQTHMTGGTARPAQWVGVTAYSDQRVESDLARMVEETRRLRDLVVTYFRERMQGIEYVEPLAGLHLFFRVDGFFSDTIRSATDYCAFLLDRSGVVLAPGGAFGDDRWVRLTYAGPEKNLMKGLDRINEQTAALASETG